MAGTRRISITNARGETLAATWHEAAQGSERDAAVATTAVASTAAAARRATVIVCHGLFSSRASNKHRAMCEGFAASGLSALRFDFAGRGDSEGDPAAVTISREVEDLCAVLDHGASVDAAPGPLVLVASSMGGTVAILTAAARWEAVANRLAGLVTIASPAQPPRQARPAWADTAGSALGEDFFSDAPRHDPLAAARRLDLPWLVVHGEKDAVVPVSDARALAAAAPQAELLLHPEAGHRFADPERRAWLIDRVVDFVIHHVDNKQA